MHTLVMNMTVCKVQRWVLGLAGGDMAASEGLVVSIQAPCTLAILCIYYLLENSALVSIVQYLMNTSRLRNPLKTVDWPYIIHMTSWHFAILCVARSNTNVQYTRRAPVYQFSVTVHCTSVLALHQQCNSALHHLDLHLTSLHFETTGDQESKMHPLPSSAANALQCVE